MKTTSSSACLRATKQMASKPCVLSTNSAEGKAKKKTKADFASHEEFLIHIKDETWIVLPRESRFDTSLLALIQPKFVSL